MRAWPLVNEGVVYSVGDHSQLSRDYVMSVNDKANVYTYVWGLQYMVGSLGPDVTPREFYTCTLQGCCKRWN